MGANEDWLFKAGFVAFLAWILIQRNKAEAAPAISPKTTPTPPPVISIIPPPTARSGSYVSVNVPYYTTPPAFQGGKAIPALVIIGYWTPPNGENFVEYIDQSGDVQIVNKAVFARYLAENNMTRNF